jgi:hypothetical protein
MTADHFSPRAFRRGLRGAGITATEYRVAVELCEYAGPGKPVVWPSIAALAEDCELDRSTVIRTLNRLEVKGFIARDSARKGGRGQSTRWRLIVKGGASATLSDTERVAPETERVANQPIKGRTSATRRSKEEERRSAGSGVPPPPALTRGAGTPSPGSDSGAALPLNHDDAIHLETWPEWAAATDISVDRPVCNDHPNGDTGKPCNGCRRAREDLAPWEEERADWRNEQKELRRNMTACSFCDERGQITTTEGLYWCDHRIPPPGWTAAQPVDCETCLDWGWMSTPQKWNATLNRFVTCSPDEPDVRHLWGRCDCKSNPPVDLKHKSIPANPNNIRSLVIPENTLEGNHSHDFS